MLLENAIHDTTHIDFLPLFCYNIQATFAHRQAISGRSETFMETVSSGYTTLTAEEKLERSATQFLASFNREMIARELKKRKRDGTTPTYTPDELKVLMRNRFYEQLAANHSATAGFEAVFAQKAKKLDELIDSFAPAKKSKRVIQVKRS